MSKKPPDMSKIIELHKTTFVDILNMFGQGKIRIEPHTPRFLTDSSGERGLPKMVDGNYAFNLSLCLFEPNTINSVLSGLSLSFMGDIHSFISSRPLFNFSKAADEFFWDRWL